MFKNYVHFIICVLLLPFSLFLSSCSTKKIKSKQEKYISTDNSNTSTTTTTSLNQQTIPENNLNNQHTDFNNPFAMEEVVLGKILAKPENIEKQEDGSYRLKNFDGSTVNLDYSVTASGEAKKVGFLIFVDGVPQIYKTNDQLEDQYCHSYHFEKDDSQYPFTITFAPNYGKKDDTVTINVVSLFNPDFMPDLLGTFGYGIYHHATNTELGIKFDADASHQDSTSGLIQARNVRLESAQLTQEFMDRINNDLGKESKLENFDKEVVYKLLINGNPHWENILIDEKKGAEIEYLFACPSGMAWSFSFFIDHKPVVLDDFTAFFWDSKKGQVARVRFSIPFEALGAGNTFYAVAVPRKNKFQGPPELVYLGMLTKSNSCFLYKKK